MFTARRFCSICGNQHVNGRRGKFFRRRTRKRNVFETLSQCPQQVGCWFKIKYLKNKKTNEHILTFWWFTRVVIQKWKYFKLISDTTTCTQQRPSITRMKMAASSAYKPPCHLINCANAWMSSARNCTISPKESEMFVVIFSTSVFFS